MHTFRLTPTSGSFNYYKYLKTRWQQLKRHNRDHVEYIDLGISKTISTVCVLGIAMHCIVIAPIESPAASMVRWCQLSSESNLLNVVYVKMVAISILILNQLSWLNPHTIIWNLLSWCIFSGMLQLRLPLVVKYVHSWSNTIKLFDKTLQNQYQVHLCILYFVHPVYLCTFSISFYILYIILPWSFQIPLLGVFIWLLICRWPEEDGKFQIRFIFNLVWGGASGETREGQPGVDISDVSRSPVMDNRMIWWYQKKFFLLLLSGDMWDRDKVQCPIIRWHLTLFTSQCLLQTVPRCLGVFCSIENVRNTRKLIFLCTTCRKY